MILTFTKECGYEIGIDSTKIVSVDNMGDYCIIDTEAESYQVTDDYKDIVTAINTLKMQHVMKFYN